MRLFSNRSQRTSKCGKNISDTLGRASCATFLFLPHFDVICDLLLNRRTATWNLLYISGASDKRLQGIFFKIIHPRCPTQRSAPFVYLICLICIDWLKKPVNPASHVVNPVAMPSSKNKIVMNRDLDVSKRQVLKAIY